MMSPIDEEEFQSGLLRLDAQVRHDYGLNEVTSAPESSIATKYVNGIDLAKPLPPIDYLSSMLGMPAGGGAPHCFGGFGFSGKTVIAQSMSLSLAADRQIWKAYGGPSRRLKISHVDNEQGIALTQRRYQRLATAMGEPLENIGDYLRVFVFPKLRNGSRVTLIPAHRNAWAEMMSDRDVLLVDSFAASRGGSSKENESEVRGGLDLLGEISEQTKCRPIVIHHATKGGDDQESKDPRFSLRGSGGIYDALDSVYLLSGAKGEPVKVEQIKARSHGEPIDDFAVVIADVPTPTEPKWGLAVHIHGIALIEERRAVLAEQRSIQQRDRDVERIRKALSGGKRLARNDLAGCAGLSGERLSRAWTRIMELGEGQVEEVRNGRSLRRVHFLEMGKDAP